MADRTVRAIFEAVVTNARKGMTDLGSDVDKAGKKVDGLTKDLKTLDAQKVKPDVDVEIDKAKAALSDLTRELGDLKKEPPSLEVDFKIEQAKAAIKDVRGLIKDLTSQKAEVRVDAGIKDAKKNIATITQELGLLRTQEVTPEVTLEIKEAQRRLREAKSGLRELNGAKAAMTVTADTSSADGALSGLKGDIADAGSEGGADAGEGLAKGIISALVAIPIAGAVIGVGAAIGKALLDGIQDGLSIEAGRDLFAARTGLDEATAARFGRSAGEAYANNFGDSIEGNLDAARRALSAGLIDSKATDAQIENVIAKLTSLQGLFDYDITESVRAVGNAMKTGLVKDANQAFDLITVASQKIPSDDLLDTINEYSNQFVLMGLSAEQSFGLLVQGAKAGARDTDIVADAIKELGIRVREDTKASATSLELLGLRGDKMADAFNKGGPAAEKAIGTILDRLRDLEAKGGNTQAVIAGLFGGPGEDLGAALYALDIDTAASALNGLEGSAGAADRALATMSDNTASKIESAKRNIEVAADGIKGALAEAFSDEIDSAADWVSRNREPIIQFFIDVLNGAIDAAGGFAEFGAQALDTIAAVAEGIAGMPSWLIGDELKDAAGDIAVAAADAADGIRNNVPAALEETRGKINDWAGPELLKARIHDATMAMAADMDVFSAKVDASGGTVQINGNKVPADEVLAILTKNIDSSDGTVTINGDKVPAGEALARVMYLIDHSDGKVTIGGNAAPGRAAVSGLKYTIDRTSGTVKVSASTYNAEQALRSLERTRYATLQVRVAGYTGQGGQVKGAHEGGWTGVLAGKNAGGWVPGSDPGYDNVLWPLNSGGRTLQQPLTGREFVVNSTASSMWGPVLEAINSGMKPGGGSGPDVASVLAAVAQQTVVVEGPLVIDGRGVGRFHAVGKRNNERMGGPRA